jgi:hypothetical protein
MTHDVTLPEDVGTLADDPLPLAEMVSNCTQTCDRLKHVHNVDMPGIQHGSWFRVTHPFG